MFGYVRAYKSELKVREYEQYKAVYCQLCRELGDSFGFGARMTLSYDCTFYAMLALSINNAKLTQCKERCRANPLKKCHYIGSGGDEYKKAAALSMLMTYHKLKDNIEDENFFKSLGSRFGAWFFKGRYKKAVKMYPFMEKVVSEAMIAQNEAEHAEDSSIDSCSEPTAHMLSMLCEELADGDRLMGAALKEFGYYFGRWVYIMDAADDLEDDLKSGSFNPFKKALGLTKLEELTEDKQKEVDLRCNEVLNSNIAMMIPAMNLLDLKHFGPIIENVIQEGMPEMQREILFLHINKKARKKTIKREE